MRVALLLHRVVEGFRFRLGHPVAVIVTGGSPDQVVPVCLVDTLGHDFRVEDDGREQFAKFLGRLSFFERKLVRRDVPHGFPEEGLAEFRFELLAAVMVVYAVGEPYAFQVDGECPEVLAVPVAGIVGVEGLQRFPYPQVVFPVLVPKDVTASQCRFGQIIYQFFPGDGQPVEPVHPVTEHLQICKLLVIIGKSFCLHVSI